MSITTIVVLLLFSALFLGGLFSPMIGILGYLSVYILYDPYAWWCKPIGEILQRPSLIAIVILVLGSAIHNYKLDWHISKTELAFYLFLFTAWIVTNFIGLEMHLGSIKYLDKILKGFVFIFFMFRIVNTMTRFKLFVWGYILGGLFLCYQAYTIGYFVKGRLENIGGVDFHEANSFAAFLAFTLILLSFEFLKMPLKWKLLFIPGLAAMVDVIVLTQSRAVFMGLALSAPFVLLTAPKIYKNQIYLYIILAALMGGMLVNEQFLGRIGTIDDTVSIQSADPLFQNENINRIDYWRASLQIFKDHPFGVGINNFHKIVPSYDYRNPGLDAHNTFVLCYSEIGIIGILLFLFIILQAFLKLRHIKKNIANTSNANEISLYVLALETSLIAYIFGGMMTHSYLYLERTWMLFALPICLERAVGKLALEATEKDSGKWAV